MSTDLEFDFVVVGGGAAGCVLAARLAADGRYTVALIERGRSDVNRWIHIPATFFKALQSQDAETILSEADPSLDNSIFPVPQGRVLGGGSSVNGMLYMRGQQQDYNDWSDRHGCTGWAFKDVLPVFKRQEKNTRLDNEYHGSDGKLVVADPSSPHPVSQHIIDAALATGIKATDDFNGASQEGAGWYQVNAYQGQRQSSAHCFLKPEKHRDNLTVLTEHSALKLLFKGRQAAGVKCELADHSVRDVLARREVILTAGSFQSPKLLMLSGIGPKDHLNQLGIELKHHADEVGANYQDHVGAPVTRKLKNAKGLHNADKGLTAVRHGIDYFLFNRGLLTTNLLQAGACVDTGTEGRPDVQYNFAPFAPGAPGKPPLPFHAVQIHPMTMRPRSRGRLSLRSSDANDAVFFEANMLSDEADLDTLRRGVRLAHDIFNEQPLREIVGESVWPITSIDYRSNNDNFDQAIRAQARTIFHPAGTCRMGSDASAVVDTKLRVNGVENLRVADCSIMPALVSGNTNAPTMMIADRCADFILEG